MFPLTRGENARADDYQKYIEKKHSTFAVEPGIITDAVEKAVGTKPLNIKRIIAGEVNEVYNVVTSKGNVIVRISHSENNRFLSEKWAIEMSHEAGVLVPEVLYIGKSVNKEKAVFLSVETKLNGISLADLLKSGKIDRQTLKVLIEDAGATLARIHSVQTEKFGNLHKGGVGDFDSWESFILHPLGIDQRKSLLKILDSVDITKLQLKKVYQILEKNSSVFNTVNPHLLHGDYGPKHILINNGRISGIIDFENAKSGDPVYDFSWWSYFYGKRLLIERLISGYQKVSNLPDNYELHLRLGRLRLGLDLLWYYSYEKHQLGLKRAKNNLIEDLKYFNK